MKGPLPTLTVVMEAFTTFVIATATRTRTRTNSHSGRA